MIIDANVTARNAASAFPYDDHSSQATTGGHTMRRDRRHTALVRVMAAVTLMAGLFGVDADLPVEADGNEAPANPTAARTLSAGGAFTCVVITTGFSNGQVKCWGANGSGQLGAGDTVNRGDDANEMGHFLPTIPLGTGRTATAVATGSGHVCVRLDDATVKCWGNNGGGRLGQGDTADRGDAAGEVAALAPVSLGTGRTATAITAGSTHTCAILDNGSVKCWGTNTSGQLGLGDTASRGDAVNEMGDNLPTVNLGAGRTATAIAAGTQFTCALLDNGNVKCWGLNSSGQLGQGDTASRGDAANEMGANLAAINLGAGRTATAITAGGEHACALLDNGTVKCWGKNAAGQLGQGDVNNRGDNASEMGGNLPAVSLGTGRTATAISAGTAHTCARLDNSTVKCWGINDGGQLGLFQTTSRGDGPNEMGDNLPAVNLGTGRTATAVTTGGDHSCVSLDNGDRKCWGLNSSGQLGQGDVGVRGGFTNSVNDTLYPIALPPASRMAGSLEDDVTGDPIPDVFVVILRSSDFGLVMTATADANGEWEASVPPGSYFAYLIDPAAEHTEGFLELDPGTPELFTLTDGLTFFVGGQMKANRGGFSGQVLDDSGAVFGGVRVLAIGPSGIAATATTAANGTYTISGLPAGSYHAAFIDSGGHHLVEYWDDSADYDGSAVIAVTAGDTTPDIGAQLALP